MSRIFEVGNKVKIIKNASSCHHVGDIGIIVKTQTGLVQFPFAVLINNHSGCYNEEEIQLHYIDCPEYLKQFKNSQ